ncbi:hypothetical protein [Brevundimonas diminuta]|uniref:hypothetical protein n=1 Tax=Brevundimonas diminuta TaxID=293 RepID=UPI001F33D625|nr:hypothetical protein [Brevundimonas diminuta]
MSAAPKFKNNVKVSERHGAGEWKLEKLALLALMPLGLWALSTGFTLAGADYGAVIAWFGSTLNAGLLAVTAVVFFLFASLAWKVILEDYVPASFSLVADPGVEPGLPRAGGRQRLLHRASGAGFGPAAGRSLIPPWLHTSLSITNTTSSSSAPGAPACAPPSAPPSRA